MKKQGGTAKSVPRVGVVGMAYGGYNLGEELGPAKLREIMARLADEPVDAIQAPRFVLSEGDARAMGADLARRDVDCILAVITTFVPDYFVTELINACDRPVFLWAVEREMQCISVVCGPLITATLYNLRKPCDLVGADVDDPAAMERLVAFARAGLMRRLLATLRVGYCGGKPPIMFSMETDEYLLKNTLGVTTVLVPVETYYDEVGKVSDADVRAELKKTMACIGSATARKADQLQSVRYLLAAKRLAKQHGLDAFSLNCFPHLKSKVCLAVARLNDAGVAAGCEGDLHSTILMHLLGRITGRPAFNGDWLRMYPGTGEVLFSHCGAGAFGLAARKEDICLRCSIETKDGLAVCYATDMPGPVTLVNMMLGPDGLRIAAMRGEGVETDLQYEGTPLKVRFDMEPQLILDGITRCGAGHHWNGAGLDLVASLRLLCRWLGVQFAVLTE